jgi:ABC-type uncharacterized transport system substrate-binding protein
MDTIRNPAEEDRKTKGDEAMQAVKDWDPDLVIAVDDNAQSYFARFLAGQDRPFVVFCGVNNEPDVYGYPAKNVTGVKEIIPWNETMALLKEIQPDTKQVMFLSEDSPTTTAAIDHIKQVNESVTLEPVRAPETFEQWQEAVLWANDHVNAIAIYRYHSFKDAHGKPIQSHDVMDWTIENTRIPVVSSLFFGIDDGALCGVVESGQQHGFEAAKMGIALLDGAAIADYPVHPASRYFSKINMTTARQMGIEIPEKLLNSVDVIIGDTND